MSTSVPHRAFAAVGVCFAMFVTAVCETRADDVDVYLEMGRNKSWPHRKNKNKEEYVKRRLKEMQTEATRFDEISKMLENGRAKAAHDIIDSYYDRNMHDFEFFLDDAQRDKVLDTFLMASYWNARVYIQKQNFDGAFRAFRWLESYEYQLPAKTHADRDRRAGFEARCVEIRDRIGNMIPHHPEELTKFMKNGADVRAMAMIHGFLTKQEFAPDTRVWADFFIAAIHSWRGEYDEACKIVEETARSDAFIKIVEAYRMHGDTTEGIVSNAYELLISSDLKMDRPSAADKHFAMFIAAMPSHRAAIESWYRNATTAYARTRNILAQIKPIVELIREAFVAGRINKVTSAVLAGGNVEHRLNEYLTVRKYGPLEWNIVSFRPASNAVSDTRLLCILFSKERTESSTHEFGPSEQDRHFAKQYQHGSLIKSFYNPATEAGYFTWLLFIPVESKWKLQDFEIH